MYKIIAPNKVTEKAWGLNFVEGEAETENDYLASKLKKKGYKVEVIKIETLEPPKDEEEVPENQEDDQSDEHTDKTGSDEAESKKTSRQKKAE